MIRHPELMSSRESGFFCFYTTLKRVSLAVWAFFVLDVLLSILEAYLFGHHILSKSFKVVSILISKIIKFSEVENKW